MPKEEHGYERGGVERLRPFLLYPLLMNPDNYDWLYNDIRIIRSDRSPCPVCGHPTGDCAPEETTKPFTHLFGVGLFDSVDKKQMYMLDDDYFVEEEVTPNHFVRVRKYRAGQEIPLSEARELGLTDL